MKTLLSFLVVVVFISTNLLYSQKPCLRIPLITYGGKLYNTVSIGSQCWMKENLDIDNIPLRNGTLKKYCVDDSIKNCSIYGGLYYWEDAMNYLYTPSSQGICPSGWHIPSLLEFRNLINEAGNNAYSLTTVGQGNGTNTTGFSALLGGFMNAEFTTATYLSRWFTQEGRSVEFLSSSYKGKTYKGTGVFKIEKNDSVPLFFYDNYSKGRFVRCIKDGSEINTDSLRNEKIKKYSALTQNVSPKKTELGKPCPGIPTVVYEGKKYNTVLIGSQCWLKENLDTGIMINTDKRQSDNKTIEKYCYNNIAGNCNKYGGLYSWNEAMNYTIVKGGRGICPAGWRIPTYVEFLKLKSTVYNNSEYIKSPEECSGTLKGANLFGFSALLAGYEANNGVFYDNGVNAFFWSSIDSGDMLAFYFNLYFNNSNITVDEYINNYAFSIRCIKE